MGRHLARVKITQADRLGITMSYAIISNSGVSMQPIQDTGERIKELAANLARDHKQDVLVISKPEPHMAYAPVLPYCVLDSQANQWEKSNGVRVPYRVL